MFRVALAVVAILAPYTYAQQQPASAPAQPAPAQGPDGLPMTQVSAGGEDLIRTLRELSAKMPADGDLTAFDQELLGQEMEIRASQAESAASLEGGATMVQLRGQARQWRAYGMPEARQRKTLTAWGDACEETLKYLTQQQVVWEATNRGSEAFLATEAVRNRIRQALASIHDLRGVADRRLRTVLDLQARVARKAAAIADTVEKLSQASQDYQKRLFVPDAPPLWKAGARETRTESRGALWSRSLRRSYSNSTDFIRSRQAMIAMALLLLVLAFALSRWLKAASRSAEAGDSLAAQSAVLAHRPFSLAMLLWTPVVLTSVAVAQMAVVLALLQVFLVPITRLLPALTGFSKRVVYCVAAFYALDGLFWIFDLEAAGGRELTIVLFSCTLAALAWRERLLRARYAAAPSRRIERERLLLRGSMAVLAAVLICSVSGFVLLANFLRVSIILSAYLALVIFTLARAASIVVAEATRSPRLRGLATIRMFQAPLQYWTRRIIGSAAIAWWVYIVLDVLGIRRETFEAVAALLNTRIGIRAVSIELGDILACIAVLACGFPVAKAIRFILREEMFSRLRLSRGVPEMLSTIAYYVALVFVFLVSISAAGVQLDKLTVLTGAVGVGVGFGLQTFVNNFVSGLVLQFERPIRVGDVLEVGTLGGEVSRIGMRSSTVRTFQGAEVIIPNSDLVSNQVVNWTLTEALRRVEVQVPVAYGTDPERVIGILTAVAVRHPEVLRAPVPAAYFQAFGASSLDFVLMFWAQQQTYVRLRSEIGVAVNAALRDEDIEIPFPQQDIRIRAADPAALPAPNGQVAQILDPAARPRHHAGVG